MSGEVSREWAGPAGWRAGLSASASGWRGVAAEVAGGRARAAGDRAGFLAHAAVAIGEYRGELAPGSFDDWVVEEREQLRRECVDLCDLAVSGWHEAGDLSRAAEVARLRIRLEPHEEAGY